MKLSTRSRYGLRLMVALGLQESMGPLFLKDIARAEDISVKYLSQIIIPLKSRGLVSAYRGAHGGYILGRHPSLIRLKEIIEVLEGDLCLVECVANPDVCGKSTECVTREVWDEMSALMIDYLEAMTLEDLIRRYKKIAQAAPNLADFSI